MGFHYFVQPLYIYNLNSVVTEENGLVCFFLFNGISTLFRLLNAKAILLEEQ